MEEMIIKTNTAGRKAIVEMCDVALKVGGVQNLNRVNQILVSLAMIEEKLEGATIDGKDSETHGG